MKTIVVTIALILAMPALLCSYTSPNGFVVENDHNYYSDFNIYNNDVINLDFAQRKLYHSQNVDAIVNVVSEVNQVPVRVSLSGFVCGDYCFNISLDKQQIVRNAIITWNYPVEIELTNLAWGIHELSISVSDTAGITIVNDNVSFAVYERDSVWQNTNGDRVVLLQPGIPGVNQEIRPVIFLEGFPIFDDSTYMNNLINAWRSSLSTASSIYQLILSDGTREVRSNAMVALAAIIFVHNHMPHQLKEGTNVFGYSMGGILARYALAYAEANNIEHYCSQYISLDAPHNGAALNENMQTMIAQLEYWLDANQLYIIANNATHGTDYDPDILDPYIRKLSSMAARQLFRVNKWVSGTHNYADGSWSFRDLYSELDDNYGTLSNVLNYDPLYPANQMKPGFPNEQNNIKCLAYSHGSLSKSGNTDNPPATIVSSYFIRFIIWDFFNWTSSDSYSADSLSYDTQPGSVFNDLRDFEQFPTPSDRLEWEFTQNYAPVIVPTRSSLGLRVNDITNPNTQIANLSMISFDNITENHSTLLNHTYFDAIVYPSSPDNSAWQWTHGDYSSSWVQTSMSSTISWMNDIAQRTIGYIEGNLVDTDPSSVHIRMFVNGILNYDGFVEANGSYRIPYKYTKNTVVRLTFDKPNFLQTSKIVDVSYQNGHISYSPISDAVLQPYNLGNIIVSQNGQFSFNNISSVVPYLLECLSSGQYNGEAIVIKVMPGIYYDSINFSPLTTGQINSLTLKGWGEEAVIDAQNTNSCIRLIGNGIGNIVIENLTITNGWSGIHVNLQNCDRLTVVDCVITNCASPYYGLGIGSNVPTTVSNCTITSNHGFDPGQGDDSTGGGLYLINNTISPTIVTDCTISQNSAYIAAAIYMEGSGHFNIRTNRILFNCSSGNTQSTDQDYYIVGSVGSALIENNIFDDYNHMNCIKIQASGSSPKLVTIKNNTFNYFDTCISVNNGSRVSITNNVFEHSLIGIYSDASNDFIQIRSNAFNTNLPFDGITYNPLMHTGCLFDEELYLDNNFEPIWNQTTMSPCIDAGTGVNDPDGTPPDIGAIPAAIHAFWDYTFRKSSAEEQPNLRIDTWHWVSYPVINSITQGKRVARSFFSELLGTHDKNGTLYPDVLQTILWKDTNTDYLIEWEHHSDDSWTWSDQTDTHHVYSPQGYKIKLLPLGYPIPVNYPSVVLHHSGFQTSPTSTFTIHGSDVANDQIYENWIGYFDTECQWPQDAFVSIWDDIIFIKAKDWCLYRSNCNNNFSAIEGTMLPLKCGDMVVVATYSDHQFQWETSNPVVPIEKEKATYFTYEEKPDYTPVEISLTGIDKADLKEIALKLNGICKGAAVAKNDVEQLCAYLDVNEKLTEGTAELIFYYESKSQPQEMKSISIDRTQLSSNSMGGVSGYPVYHISVTPNDMADNIDPVLSLEQNYPNPFNPTTIIKYSLDEPGAVSLEIYNIKGQLVNTLVQGNADKGVHNVVWDGIDQAGNPCSSGVYFYKLRTNSRSLVRKMLMLK